MEREEEEEEDISRINPVKKITPMQINNIVDPVDSRTFETVQLLGVQL